MTDKQMRLQLSPTDVTETTVYNLDPLKRFTHVPVESLLDACGPLPVWMAESFAWTNNMKQMLDNLSNFYPYPMSEIPARIEDEMFKYPGDPELYPIIRVEHNDFIGWVYRYSLVAFKHKPTDTYYMTRMD